MRSLRRALELLIGISAIMWTAPATSGPVVAPMPDSSPAAAQTLVDALLNPFAAGTLKLVAGSVAYKGAPFASGLFSNGGSDSATTIPKFSEYDGRTNSAAALDPPVRRGFGKSFGV